MVIIQIQRGLLKGYKLGNICKTLDLAAIITATEEIAIPRFVDSFDKDLISDLYLATFYYGLGTEMLDKEYQDKGIVRFLYKRLAESSIYLARAFTKMRMSDWTAVITMNGTTNRSIQPTPTMLACWQSQCVGATAVAQVIRAMDKLGLYDLYLPTCKEDAYDKIDLIALAKGKDFGLVLQIKARIRHTTMCNIAQSSAKHDQKFLEGAEKFTKREGGYWIPVNILVNSHTINSNERCLDIEHKIRKMLEGNC